MREYGFYDSPVMRELERQEIAKNGPDKPIKKAASIEPTDLLSKLANLSKNLRKSGKTEQADRLDYKVAMYVTAAEKNTHLYRTHDEDGEDLIEFAHPDGDVEICPSSGGYGKVETQLSQHKKIVDMVQKEPTGNYATASILEDVAGVLGLKKKADLGIVTKYNNYINYVLENLAIGQGWSNKPNFYFTGVTSTTGIGFDTVGGGISGSNVVVVERGQEDPRLPGMYYWHITRPDLYKILGGSWTDGTPGSIQDFKTAHGDLISQSQGKFEGILQTQIGEVEKLKIGNNTGFIQVKANIESLHRLRGNEASWKWYYAGNPTVLNNVIEGLGYAITPLTSIYETLVLMENWARLQYKDGNPYVAPTIGNMEKFMVEFKVSNVEDFQVEVNKRIQEYVDHFKKSSAKVDLEKIAQLSGARPGKPVQPTAPVAAPAATKPAPATTGTGTRQPAYGKRDITKRMAELTNWHNTHLPEYWQAVQQMQSQLHNLADALKNINASTYALLTGTAIKEFRDQKIGQFDGQWGEGTAAALKAAKEELLKLNPDASKIKEGPSSGLMYFAGKDKEKQKQVGRIAEENTRIISEILSKAGLSSSTGVASGTVFDYVPKNIDWSTDAFATTAPDKDLGDVLAANNLSSLSAFSSWLELSYGDLGSDLSSNVKYLYDALKLLLNRATLLVKNNQAPASQPYVDAIKSLLTRTLEAFRSWQQKNPGKNPTVSDLEPKGPGKTPGTTGTGEGMDLQTGESAQVQRQVYELLNDTIYPRHIAQSLPNTIIGAGLADVLAGSIRRDTIRTLVNNPEGLFDAIINIREDQVPWSKILQVTGYNPTSPALFFNRSGQAVPLQLGNSKGERANATMVQLDSFRDSPPAQRVIREWKLIYVIRALKAIDADILKIANEIGRNYSDNVALINKIEEQKVRWVRDINAAIRSAEESLRGLRTGRGQKNWAW
jgi:hypothetical protein